MSELFNSPDKKPSWSPDKDRSSPVIELKELVLLGAWTAPDATIVRRVGFRPGLNIVWADPKVEEANAGGDRTSGHSAGKTTLCRVLRWLLGETHYGTPDLEARIATKFIKGWAVLSLHLAGRPWVIGRSFFSKQDHQAIPDFEVDDVLSEGWPKESSIKFFFAEVERLTLASLAKRRFPGRNEDIEWTQLLAWLARDQEAALQSVEAWRSVAGGPQERGPTKFERHVLIRLVSDLLSVEEWKEMDKEARAQADKEKLVDELPGIQAVADEACEPLRRVFGGDGNMLAGELVIAKARQAVAQKEDQLKDADAAISSHGARQAQQNHEQALRALERAEGELAQRKRRSKSLQNQLSELAGAIIKATAVLEQRKPPPGYCARKKEEAEHKCPLYLDGVETIGAAALWLELEEKQQAIQSKLGEETTELADLDARMPLLRHNEETLRTAADQLAAEREEMIKGAERIREQVASDHAVLLPALQRRKAFDEHSARINDISDDIKRARQQQTQIRQGHWNDRLGLAEHYRAVLSYLLGPKVGGNITFDKDGQLVLEAENRSALSSAAIEALKSVSFDLASVFRSVSGGGQHPRFLIHDSPKVADMSPVPYAALFDLVRDVEKRAEGSPNFQYIITTTESPPADFRNSDHMILMLDASTKEGRLFKEDL
jgi:hypothetical protein